jgi:hypothetical protein
MHRLPEKSGWFEKLMGKAQMSGLVPSGSHLFQNNTMNPITIFTYRAVEWINGKLAETTVQAIGFTDVVWMVGSKLGEFRFDEELKEWFFYPLAILPTTPLTAKNLQTITEKLNKLNADAIPTKKGSGFQHEKVQALRKEKVKAPERD